MPLFFDLRIVQGSDRGRTYMVWRLRGNPSVPACSAFLLRSCSKSLDCIIFSCWTNRSFSNRSCYSRLPISFSWDVLATKWRRSLRQRV